MMNNLGNESEAHGSHCGLAEEWGHGFWCWEQRSARPGWRWNRLRALPAGLTLLAPWEAPWTAFLHFLPSLRPQKNQAWSQARLRKALGTGAARKPGSNPEAGASPDRKVRLPRGPSAGNLPVRKARRSLAPCRAGLARSSAPPGASMQDRFPTDPSAVPAARKSSRASSTGLRRSYAHRREKK